MSKHILVADDDEAIVEAISMVLEDEGYEVSSECEGGKLKQLLNMPDLILLDIWMSGTDGKEIAIFFKSQESTCHIPIIMVSANRDGEAIAKEVGAEGFIAKPFDIDDLIGEIERVLSQIA